MTPSRVTLRGIFIFPLRDPDLVFIEGIYSTIFSLPAEIARGDKKKFHLSFTERKYSAPNLLNNKNSFGGNLFNFNHLTGYQLTFTKKVLPVNIVSSILKA